MPSAYNPGYLRVALPLLASCAWLTVQPGTNRGVTYSVTSEGRIAMALAPRLYTELASLFLPNAMVALARRGIFDRLREGPADVRALEGNAESLTCISDLLAIPGWVAQTKHGVQLTARGRYAAQTATSYAVTESYLPMLAALPTLLFGNPRVPRIDADGVETLVNRAVNVRAAAGLIRRISIDSTMS